MKFYILVGLRGNPNSECKNNSEETVKFKSVLAYFDPLHKQKSLSITDNMC